MDFDHRPLTRKAFAPGEVRVSYEHNEAYAAFKYSNDESRYENILGGPIELGMIVIPGSDEAERVEQPE